MNVIERGGRSRIFQSRLNKSLDIVVDFIPKVTHIFSEEFLSKIRGGCSASRLNVLEDDTYVELIRKVC